MSFKENLLKKIKIDNLTKKVLDTIGPSGSGMKVDKKAMISLFEMDSYTYRKERDLDLYIKENDPGKGHILVLDNDLTVYDTSVEDVAMRKSPVVKEMLNIRNIIKILNDKDVVVSKKEPTVLAIQKEYIDALDLSYNESDIEGIEKDGTSAQEKGDTDSVIEALSLFAELLGYAPPPKAIATWNYEMIGPLTKAEDGKVMYGPIVIYSIKTNTIKLIDMKVKSTDKEKIEHIHQVAIGKEKAAKEGSLVFRYLREEVLKLKT